MTSLWKNTASFPSFPRLENSLNTDVLIIGGGLTGLLCAYTLAQEGIDYVLVEAGTVCGKTTGNTTAKITFQHGLIYHKLIDTVGPEKAKMYLEANRAALERYRLLCDNIDCDFETKDAIVYSLDSPKKIEQECIAYQQLGVQAEYLDTLPLPFPVAGAVRLQNHAQLHPLKLAAALSARLNIYEHTPVLSYDGRRVITPYGHITASRIIVATHFPMFNKHGAFFLKMYQHRSYVIALEDAANLQGMYVDEKDSGLSFRTHGRYLLLGGGSHRTGKSGGNWTELRRMANQYYPGAKESFRWAAQDCMPLDGIPYIGEYSKSTPHLYVATGFQKWGFTSAMVASKILCDLIQGHSNCFADVFSPQRTMLHPQLIKNIWESGIHLLTPTAPRCPHMGCALKWNPQEHSWDCPCHGSRFTEEGIKLENPANSDGIWNQQKNK